MRCEQSRPWSDFAGQSWGFSVCIHVWDMDDCTLIYSMFCFCFWGCFFCLFVFFCFVFFYSKQINRSLTRYSKHLKFEILWIKQCNINHFLIWAISADDKLMIFLFFPERMLWHFMQIVSLRDNLYEMPKPIFFDISWRQFVWNLKVFFLGKKITMSSARFIYPESYVLW